MEIEHAIIEALKESRTYAKLIEKTKSLRKKKGFGCSNEDFSNALKRLVEGRIVLKPEKRGGKWKLNIDKGIREVELYIREKPHEFFDLVETRIKILEKYIPHLKKEEKVITKIQNNITDTIRILLYNQLLLNLFIGTVWRAPVSEREFKFQTKRCKELIKKLSHLTERLDKSGSEVTFSILVNEIQKEFNTASKKEYESRNILNKFSNHSS